MLFQNGEELQNSCTNHHQSAVFHPEADIATSEGHAIDTRGIGMIADDCRSLAARISQIVKQIKDDRKDN